MEQDKFNIIMDALNKIIEESYSSTQMLGKKECILYLNNNDFNNFFKKAEKTLSYFDKSINDFYHLIGMGNLNASQITTICKTMKELCNQRHYIKKIINLKQQYKIIRESTVNDERKYLLTILDKSKSFSLVCMK